MIFYFDMVSFLMTWCPFSLHILRVYYHVESTSWSRKHFLLHAQYTFWFEVSIGFHKHLTPGLVSEFEESERLLSRKLCPRQRTLFGRSVLRPCIFSTADTLRVSACEVSLS